MPTGALLMVEMGSRPADPSIARLNTNFANVEGALKHGMIEVDRKWLAMSPLLAMCLPTTCGASSRRNEAYKFRPAQ
jgi:hypothetical protein